MRRVVAAFVSAVLIGFGIAVVLPAGAAEAATTKFTTHGIKITVPSSVTTYNGKKASVKPKATVQSGVNEKLVRTKILVYRGGKKLTSGTTVKLKPGSYKQRIQLTYKSWKYTTRTSTKRVLKDPDDVADGGSASDVTCKITAVQDEDDFDFTDGALSAVCTSPHYPGQKLSIGYDDWCADDLDYPYAVGQTTTDNICYDMDDDFAPYYVNTKVKTKVKTAIKNHTVTTGKRKLVVVDGGHRLQWSGGYIKDDDGYTTRSFTVPSNWKLTYDYGEVGDDYGIGCVFDASVYQYSDRYGTGRDWYYIDNVVNAWDEGDSGWVKYRRTAGKTRVWVNSSCDYWDITVTWK